jgi:dolichyl-phosphate beta-glucosyltransferase
MTQPYLTLIVPAYNEVKTIRSTLEQIFTYFAKKGFSYEIIVSADGNDGTREASSELASGDSRLIVIGSEQRRGKGYSIRSAVELASGEIIGFMDADNKTPISEFDKFEMMFQDYDVVIGSRGLRQSRIERRQPLYRRIGSRGFAVIMHLLVGIPDIVDTQCGFKFFSRPCALELFARQKIYGYMFDVEILYLAERLGYRIAQVPVLWRDDGDSRLNLILGNIQNLTDIVRIRSIHSGSRNHTAITDDQKGRVK